MYWRSLACQTQHLRAYGEEAEFGAGSRVRTDDLLITNQLLYQLSYAGFSAKTEPETNGDWPGAQPVFLVALCNRIP